MRPYDILEEQADTILSLNGDWMLACPDIIPARDAMFDRPVSLEELEECVPNEFDRAGYQADTPTDTFICNNGDAIFVTEI